MKLNKYLKDKILSISIYFVISFLIILLLFIFKVKLELIICIIFLLIINLILIIGLDFYNRNKFYNYFLANLNKLDKKYLINEMVYKPNFYEGEILYNSLYEINKSMIENINEYKYNINDFKEYLEMWIHEIKIPISSLVLLNHNEKRENKKYRVQIKRLDDYIDQILYYVRSENIEKDFSIKETNIDEVINNVLIKNKIDLLENKIDIEVNTNDVKVLTDFKWLEFILNQIINNSIKYKCENDSKISIIAIENIDNILLKIKDNGIGISKSDLSRVFEKSFTGENGREKTKSTGMGLYIVKKLCDRLGHKIEVDSEKNKYTEMTIIFNKNDYYKM